VVSVNTTSQILKIERIRVWSDIGTEQISRHRDWLWSMTTRSSVKYSTDIKSMCDPPLVHACSISRCRIMWTSFHIRVANTLLFCSLLNWVDDQNRKIAIYTSHLTTVQHKIMSPQPTALRYETTTLHYFMFKCRGKCFYTKKWSRFLAILFRNKLNGPVCRT
jgi:hypothetical protein